MSGDPNGINQSSYNCIINLIMILKILIVLYRIIS